MRFALRLALALGPVTSVAAGCFTFISFDPEGAGGAGSSGATATGVGGGGTGGTSTTVGAGGSGGSGGSGGCGNLGDPNDCGAFGVVCGPASSCCDGVCTPVGTPFTSIEEIVRVKGQVVTRAGNSFQLWSTDNPPVPVRSGNAVVDDAGSGYSLGGDQLVYRAQDAVGCGDACMTAYVVLGSTLACSHRATWGNSVGHINGTVKLGTDFFFVASGSRQVYRSDAACLFDATGSCLDTAVTCIGTAVVTDMRRNGSADLAPPSLLEYDPVDHSLWWNTWEGCVYKAPTSCTTGCDTSCAVSDVDLPKPGRLTASAAGVFVATNETANQTDGPVYLIDNLVAVPLEVGTARWPMDSDETLLFAADVRNGSTPAVVAVRPDGTELAHTGPLAGTRITALDASDPSFVYFATENMLYRWAKPRVCKNMICGDACVGPGLEECDDGNSDLGDGCDSSCKLE